MALLHRAELRPSKIELISGWAPTQPWFVGDATALTQVGSYRFDDPLGEAGIETLLVRSGVGPVLQVPLTYRGAPFADADAWLIATMQHSVLGKRWVYDATGDPAYLAALATTALTGGSQAEQYVEVDGTREYREPTASVTGSGKSGTAAFRAADLGSVTTRHEDGVTVAEAQGTNGRAMTLTIVRAIVAAAGRSASEAAPGSGVDTDSASATLSGTWSDQPERLTLAVVRVR